MTDAFEIRVEKGHAEPDEIAALVAVLRARTAAAEPSVPPHTAATWRTRAESFEPPHSWRST